MKEQDRKWLDVRSIKDGYIMENKWNEHPAKKLFDNLIEKFGIDLSKWKLGDYDDLTHDNFIRICYGNIYYTEFFLIFEFSCNKKGKWKLEETNIIF